MCILGAFALGGAAFAVADASNGAVAAAVWQHHKAAFDYVGFTTSYSCNGLEGQVRSILLHLGARRDMKVRATGCPGPYGAPSRFASMDVEFYSLAPAADAGGPDSVPALWGPVELTPRRPSFMGEGDCELIQGMKNLITGNFTMRDIDYRTDCIPHQQVPDGFAVKGQTLRAAPPAPGAAQR
jgi:hypothetical protein